MLRRELRSNTLGQEGLNPTAPKPTAVIKEADVDAADCDCPEAEREDKYCSFHLSVY